MRSWRVWPPAIATAWGSDRAEDVFEAAIAGDRSAAAILARAATALGSSLAFLANVADPGAIVIGGGLSSAPGPFWGDVERETRARIWSESTRSLPFLLTELGSDAGIVGAACLAWAGEVTAARAD